MKEPEKTVKICNDCKFWQQVWQGMGTCEQIINCHYKHILLSTHPACKVMKGRRKYE